MSENIPTSPVTPGDDNDTPQDGGSGMVKVNSQIVDAVRQTRNAVRIDASDTSKVVDPGIAYQKASQAAAFAVQDATDYLRNIMTIASTAQGMALKMYLETQVPTPWADIITEAQKAVTAAAENLEKVGQSATSVATNFPR
jgi:hypothetical protein